MALLRASAPSIHPHKAYISSFAVVLCTLHQDRWLPVWPSCCFVLLDAPVWAAAAALQPQLTARPVCPCAVIHSGEVLTTVPTIGFNVEKVQYKNVIFTVWDVGGQEKLRPLWRHYFNSTDGLIFVVDCQDRERVGKAAEEFKAIVQDPLMLHSAILVFANKQDMKGCLTPAEVCEALGLRNLKGRAWHVQSSIAIRGEGLYEGLDWLANTLKSMNSGRPATRS